MQRQRQRQMRVHLEWFVLNAPRTTFGYGEEAIGFFVAGAFLGFGIVFDGAT